MNSHCGLVLDDFIPVDEAAVLGGPPGWSSEQMALSGVATIAPEDGPQRVALRCNERDDASLELNWAKLTALEVSSVTSSERRPADRARYLDPVSSLGATWQRLDHLYGGQLAPPCHSAIPIAHGSWTQSASSPASPRLPAQAPLRASSPTSSADRLGARSGSGQWAGRAACRGGAASRLSSRSAGGAQRRASVIVSGRGA
jgi:hypothetical protein